MADELTPSVACRRAVERIHDDYYRDVIEHDFPTPYDPVAGWIHELVAAPLEAENERLKAVCAGRNRALEMGEEPSSRTDFDELCNRVVSRESFALDQEFLVGFAQASFDVETQLRSELAEAHARIKELESGQATDMEALAEAWARIKELENA